MATSEKIYEHARACEAAFSLITRDQTAPSYVVAETLRQRFEQWSSNMGVFAVAQLSLDARLAHSDSLRNMVLDLLELMKTSLDRVRWKVVEVRLDDEDGETQESIVEQIPTEEAPTAMLRRMLSDKEQGASSKHMSASEMHEALIKHMTREPRVIGSVLVESLRALKSVVDSLDRLGSAIRQSSSAERLTERIENYMKKSDNGGVLEDIVYFRLKFMLVDGRKYNDGELPDNARGAALLLCRQLAVSVAYRYSAIMYRRQHVQKRAVRREDKLEGLQKETHEDAAQRPAITSTNARGISTEEREELLKHIGLHLKEIGLLSVDYLDDNDEGASEASRYASAASLESRNYVPKAETVDGAWVFDDTGLADYVDVDYKSSDLPLADTQTNDLPEWQVLWKADLLDEEQTLRGHIDFAEKWRSPAEDLLLTDPRDYKTRMQNTNGGLLRDSYRWILENNIFRQWRSGSQGRILWIRGGPGSGKTMLLCGIIDELEPTTCLSYFFCHAANEQLNNATAVLRGLIYMLIRQRPALISYVRDKYDSVRKRLFEEINAWQDLSKIFTDMLADEQAANAILLVDALDEFVFSPDGTQLASGSYDKTVKLWDTASGECTQTLKGHSQYVTSVVFSPDGTQLASGSYDETVKLWDTASGECTQTLKGHSHAVTSVVFSPDGTQLASGSHDETVKLWDTASRECHTLKGHSQYVTSVVFSPDGTQLASGSDDKTVKLWDTASRECTHILQGHTNSVTSVVFSPDGTRLASGSHDKTVNLWDIASRECYTLKSHSHYITSVVFSPDGTQLASGSYDETVKLWDTASREGTQTLKGHSHAVTSVVFSPDGTQLASGSYDKTVKLWDTASGECAQTLRGHIDSVTSIVFSPDGTQVASGSYDKTVKLWDTASGECTHTLKGHIDSVTSIVFSPDGTQLASGSYDETVKLWDIASGKCTQTLKGHNDSVTAFF
ncbi:hypothetical protein SEUCBS139899_009987 [Sporothrix eucalyptigena]